LTINQNKIVNLILTKFSLSLGITIYSILSIYSVARYITLMFFPQCNFSGWQGTSSGLPLPVKWAENKSQWECQ